jgi:hypothetical protein
MSPIMATLRCCVIIVMYIVIHVSWIEGDLPLNMSHKASCGKHVGCGVTPQEIQNASYKDKIMKLVLLEKL